MRTSIGKWGNSLALRLPRVIAEQIELREGSPVILRVNDGSLIITPSRPRYSLDELLANHKQDDAPKEVDWGAPEGKEEW